MDAARVDELLSRAVEDQVAEYREWRLAMDALGDRVERLETAVHALCEDLDRRVEGAARDAVSEQLEQLSGDIRRQISDLGRLIVNDLGRLPKLLATPAAPDLDLRDEPDPDALPYASATESAPRGRFRRR